MAIDIIIQNKSEDQIEKITLDIELNKEDWEEQFYKIGCNLIVKIFTLAVCNLEEHLCKSHPKDWQIVGFRSRTLVTRFGNVTFDRRLYIDSQGQYHFLLDEYMDWKPNQSATPSLTAALVKLSTEIPFGKVSETMEGLLAGVLSKATVHRLLQKISSTAIQMEKEEYESSFNGGKLPEPGDKKASVVFTEADSIWVHLQREKNGDKRQKHYELKNAIAYEGWERLNQQEERYKLAGKVVYCRSDDSIPLWDGASLEWHKHWDLSYMKGMVVNGDGAKWIDKGVDELPDSVRQLDGFHLARACSRGWKRGDLMYEYIRSGTIRQVLGDAEAKEGKTAQKAREYVVNHIDDGMDWRKKVEGTKLANNIPEGARGLGCMESNEDKLFANRMKKRGMSWTIKGANRMGKAIQLAYNGNLKDLCSRKLPESRKLKPSFDLFEHEGSNEIASLPALESQYASRPWGRALKDLAKPNNLLN
jgi:hypothetical protein